jgi:hypothetical protein
MIKTLTCLVFLFAFASAQAEVRLIPFQASAENKTDIPTVFWPKPNSKAVLIFLPGGGGSFGMTKKPDPQPNWVLGDLYQSTSAAFDLVFMDSYFQLQTDFGSPYSRWAPRRDANHLKRIKSTVEYYRDLTGKPIFLLGHSNGTLSIAEFLNQSTENQKLLGGFIFSGSRNETELKNKLVLPALVLHHKADPNRWTTPGDAEKLFSFVKQNNSAASEQKWVEGGKDVPQGDPTHSGRHMYHEAVSEAAGLVQAFIDRAVAK